jgi:P-type E1-E2 ATPase
LDLTDVRASHPPGAVTVAIGVDGKLQGVLILADELRAGTAALLRNLKALGIDRIVLATGDRRDVAEVVAKGLSIDAVRSELTPDQKTLVVLSERKHGPVMMIGDGVNDAPALAAADLGVAMGAKGAAASAEAADIVLLVDQLDRILPAIAIARRSRLIALQSVFAGMGLSILGMVAAAFGLISPVQGAVLQELIDVAVILNSLRALYEEVRCSASVSKGNPGERRQFDLDHVAAPEWSLSKASTEGDPCHDQADPGQSRSCSRISG